MPVIWIFTNRSFDMDLGKQPDDTRKSARTTSTSRSMSLPARL